ncbi:MAG TPA: bifunctional diguanylate cyclase/phosphodiesterase [Acidimicrobiales bacterium]|nr:bifunctional diguanylate cyclase/phosphodiesterase [Acidimicrobiales bacterium]
MTGLLDLSGLRRALARAVRGARQSGGSCGLVLLDLDGFGAVNHSLGWAVGDRVLVEVAARLRTWACGIPEGAVVARVAADEFAVLLPHADGTAMVARADQLQELVGRPLRVGSRELVVGCAVGYAAGRDITADELLRRAGAALARAKRRRRDAPVAYHNALGREASWRLETEQAIRSALASGGPTVKYQPIVDLQSGRVIGTEALARLPRPDGRLAPPASFIPVAEESGLIVELGAAVLRAACRQQVAWHRLGQAGPDFVTVNLSGRQVTSPTMRDTVTSALEDAGLPPQQLVLELTEAVAIDTPDALSVVSSLSDLGVRFALDDFGTGWSSLSLLKRFPIDILKVDISFVAGLGRVDDDTAVVRALIELAHALGLTTIAEGVETAAQEKILARLGCDAAQGYRYVPPRVPEWVLT